MIVDKLHIILFCLMCLFSLIFYFLGCIKTKNKYIKKIKQKERAIPIVNSADFNIDTVLKRNGMKR